MRGAVMGRPAGWLAGPVAVVAFAALVAGGLALLAVPAMVTWLNVGSPGDDRYVTSLYPAEQNATESFRWTTGTAIVAVPVPTDSHYRVELRVAGSGDERPLSIECPGGGLQTRLTPGQLPGAFTIECDAVAGRIALEISVPTMRVEGDGRPLGVAVVDVRAVADESAESLLWRLRAGLSIAASVVGSWLALAALGGRRVASIVGVLGVLAVAVVAVIRPELVLAMVSGPGGLIALTGGYAAWLLAGGRRTAPVALGVVAVGCWLLVGPVNPGLLLPARWTPGDADGYRLLTLAAAFGIVAASALGGPRVAPLAAMSSLVAAGAALVPVVARLVYPRWSLTLFGPDWIDRASVCGGILLVVLAALTLGATWAGARARIPAGVAVVIVVSLPLSILLPWRATAMNLNGDEPHYYVTAKSIGEDGDLELLDDYLDPEYRRETISPTGNIAVERETAPDRYRALWPLSDAERWYLVPDGAGLVADVPAGLMAAGGMAAPLVSTDSDHEDSLPPLAASNRLAIPLSGPCDVQGIWVGSPDRANARFSVELLDGSGATIWRADGETAQGIAQVTPEPGVVSCATGFVGSVTIAADFNIVAEAVDRGGGLRVLAGAPVSERWLLGPLPRDRYATREATARLVIHNPHDEPATAVVRLVTTSDSVLRVTSVRLGSRASVAIDLDVPAGAAVEVEGDAPLGVGGSCWLPGGSFGLPVMVTDREWSLAAPRRTDGDAGVWIGVVNPAHESVAVTIVDGTSSSAITLCGYCADIALVPSDPEAREIVVRSDRPVAMAAVTYEERTGALHFDLGLPVLAVLPVVLTGPAGAPVVSAIATVLLALGMLVLLRRIGVEREVAICGAVAVAMLAPLSPYAVRLYTEPLAACLVVGALVCWERGQLSAQWLSGCLALAGALPFVHGRYTALAVGLAGLCVWTVARHRRVTRWQLALGAAVLLVVAGLMAFSPLAVALRERANGGYFSTEWVPHNLLGIVIDRGSGVLPFAPWCLLALAGGRPRHRLQRAAVILIVAQLTVVALRAGGWQTFGPPARYVLPVVPLVALLAVPAAVRLARTTAGTVAIVAALGWSAIVTILLHWLPLTGYVREGRYFIDAARRELPILLPLEAMPRVAPQPASNLLGLALLIGLWMGASLYVWRSVGTGDGGRRTRKIVT